MTAFCHTHGNARSVPSHSDPVARLVTIAKTSGLPYTRFSRNAAKSAPLAAAFPGSSRRSGLMAFSTHPFCVGPGVTLRSHNGGKAPETYLRAIVSPSTGDPAVPVVARYATSQPPESTVRAVPPPMPVMMGPPKTHPRFGKAVRSAAVCHVNTCVVCSTRRLLLTVKAYRTASTCRSEVRYPACQTVGHVAPPSVDISIYARRESRCIRLVSVGS